LISEAHFEQGFKCCVDTINDLKLDVPNAKTILDELIQQAKKENFLAQSFNATPATK
jgi:hypothetical protein